MIGLDEVSPENALAGAALFSAGLALTPLCVVFARRFSPPAPVFFARWRFLHAALLAAVLVLGMRFAPNAASALLAPLFEDRPVPEALLQLLAAALALGAAAAVAVAIAARADPAGARSLGLEPQGSLRAALVGVASYGILSPGILGASLAWPWLFERLGGDFQPQDVAVGIASLAGAERLAAGALAILVLPFLEELVFRGFLQPLFVQNLGDRGGVFLTSLVFATLHGDSALLPILALALLLGSLKLCTQRLSACVAVHALHNAVVFLLLPG